LEPHFPVELSQEGESNHPSSLAPTDIIPSGLVEMLAERGRYEEAVLERIKRAYDENDLRAVMDLLGKLFYEGPGATKKEPTDSDA